VAGEAAGPKLLISPLVGEMSGRTEGVAKDRDLSSYCHEKAKIVPLRHHTARWPADAGHRLLGRGQDRDRKTA
ncbi:hypothetical protein FJ934_26710, partial [Mesorhizobium sp. B2-4-12]